MNYRAPRTNIGLAFFFLLIFAWSPVCRAHKINVFAWIEQDRIMVESSFSGGRKMVNGSIRVTNQRTGDVILTGKTNADGLFSFTLPKALYEQAPVLVITAGSDDGHQANWILRPADYIPGFSADATDTSTDIPVQSENTTKETATCVSRGEMEQILEIKLAPIRRNLASLSDPAPSLKEIFSGIGYLIGFGGIIAWMKSRRKK